MIAQKYQKQKAAAAAAAAPSDTASMNGSVQAQSVRSAKTNQTNKTAQSAAQSVQTVESAEVKRTIENGTGNKVNISRWVRRAGGKLSDAEKTPNAYGVIPFEGFIRVCEANANTYYRTIPPIDKKMLADRMKLYNQGKFAEYMELARVQYNKKAKMKLYFTSHICKAMGLQL